MRLFCINSKGWMRIKPYNSRHMIIERPPGPQYGHIVTATSEVAENGKLYYFLQEWLDLGPYDARGFIALEAKTEELVVEEQLEPMEVL